jgi:hypothetical protein
MLMKISSGFKSLPPDSVAAARSCLTINLLGLPGLGSWIAGRRVGLIQAALALLGMIVTATGCISFVVAWIRAGQLPETLMSDLRLSFEGVALFLTGWVWALITSLSIMRIARATRQ